MLDPVVKTVDVPAEPDVAFARFTRGIGGWWPRRTHSVSQEKCREVAMECRQGGRLFERDAEGREHPWGTVTAYEPPTRLAFTWHPGRAADTAQRVEVSFEPTAAGTRVRLVHRDWELLGDEAETMRGNYDAGWDPVLAGYRQDAAAAAERAGA